MANSKATFLPLQFEQLNRPLISPSQGWPQQEQNGAHTGFSVLMHCGQRPGLSISERQLKQLAGYSRLMTPVVISCSVALSVLGIGLSAESVPAVSGVQPG